MARCKLVYLNPHYYSEYWISFLYRFALLLIIIMFFDSRHPRVRNFNSVISIDVIRINSYVACFFNPSCVTGRVIINISILVLNRKMSCFIGVYRNCHVLNASKL